MSEINSPEIISKRRPQKRDHSFKIRGNVFDLYTQMARKGGKRPLILYKRYFVSAEFVQLFFKLHDGEFDKTLYDQLTDKERREMAHVVNYLDIDNREFTVALSQLNRAMFSRLQLIEGAIKAGNLSSELRDEYVNIMTEMGHLGMIPVNTASRYVTTINRTYDALNKSDTLIRKK